MHLEIKFKMIVFHYSNTANIILITFALFVLLAFHFLLHHSCVELIISWVTIHNI